MQGSGEGPDPKELLTASAASYFFMTFVHLVEARKLPLTEISMETSSSELKGNDLTITHYPRLVLEADANEKDVSRVKKAVESADRTCPVGNFLKNAGASIFIESSFVTKG